MSTIEEMIRFKDKDNKEEIGKELAKMREQLPPGEPPEPKAKSLGAATAKEKSAENETKEKIFKERADKMFASVFSSIREEAIKKAYKKGTEEEKNSRLQSEIERMKSAFLEFSGNETNANPSLDLSDNELGLEILRFCAEKGETESKALKRIVIDKFGKKAEEVGGAVEAETRERIEKEGETREGTVEKPKSKKAENTITFLEFSKKYGSIFKVNLFDREGNWIYVSDYSEKTEKAAVRSGKKGSEEKERRFLPLEELDELLANYKKPAEKIEKEENIKNEEKLKEDLTGIETEEKLLGYLNALGKYTVISEKGTHFYFPAYIQKVEKVLRNELSWNDIGIPALRNKVEEIIKKRKGEKQESLPEDILELSDEEMERKAVEYFISKAREFISGMSDEGEVDWKDFFPQEKKDIIMTFAKVHLRGLLKKAKGIKEEKIEDIIAIVITQIQNQ